MRRKISLVTLFILLISTGISGCQAVLTPTTGATQMIAATTSTPEPTASATPNPTSTQTQQPQPTSTQAPTATQTPTQVNPGLALTPLPQLSETITAENIQNLQLMAVWGTGKAREIAVSLDGLQLVVGTSIGAFMYDIATYEELAVLSTPYPVDAIAFSIDNQLIALGQSHQVIDIFAQNNFEHVIRLELMDWDLDDDHDISLHFSPLDNSLVSMIRTSERIYINRWDSVTWALIDAFSIQNGTASYAVPEINLLGILREDSLILQSVHYPDDIDSVKLPADLTPDFIDQISENKGEIIPASTGDFLLLNDGTSLTHWTISEVSVSYRFDDYPQVETPSCYDAPPSCLDQSGSYSWDCPPTLPINPIEKAVLTPDNIMMLILLNSGSTEFRRASDGLFAWSLDIQFTDVTFSPGGDLFFGIRSDGTIEKRSTLDGGLIDSLSLHPSQLLDLAYSPDGAIIAASFSDGWIRIFSAFNGQMLGVLDGIASALAFSPDSGWLAAGLVDGTLRIFELAEGRYFVFSEKHHAAITDLAFSSDGAQLATSSADCTVSLYDPFNRYRVRNLSPSWQTPYQVTGIDFYPDDDFQFISGNREVIASVDGTQVNEVLLTSQFGFNDIEVSPDGNWLAAAGFQSWLFSITDEGAVSETFLLEDVGEEGNALDFSLDGSLLAISGQDNLFFWSVDPIRLIGMLSTEPITTQSNLPVALTFSPDGGVLVLANQDGQISIYAIP